MFSSSTPEAGGSPLVGQTILSSVDRSRIDAMPSVTSTLFNLSQEPSDGPDQPFAAEEASRALERDLEWMVEALC